MNLINNCSRFAIKKISQGPQQHLLVIRGKIEMKLPKKYTSTENKVNIIVNIQINT